MERYNDQGQQSLFRIALPELIGQQLLQSKLTALQLKHPDLQLEISTSVVPVDFSRRKLTLFFDLSDQKVGVTLFGDLVNWNMGFIVVKIISPVSQSMLKRLMIY